MRLYTETSHCISKNTDAERSIPRLYIYVLCTFIFIGNINITHMWKTSFALLEKRASDMREQNLTIIIFSYSNTVCQK